jgi:hypothetical protein
MIPRGTGKTMKRISSVLVVFSSVLVFSACGSTPPVADSTETPTTATVTAPNVDAELDQLKAVTPGDACAWLPAEKLAATYPDGKFKLNQKVEPRLVVTSGIPAACTGEMQVPSTPPRNCPPILLTSSRCPRYL